MNKTKEGRRGTTTAGVMDFLRHVLPKEVLLGLYEEDERGRFVCRAVLQQLSSVTQQVVVRLSCCAGEFPAAGVHVWTKLTPAQLDTVFVELFEWGIVPETLSSATLQGKLIQMTPQFLKGLQESMRCLRTSPWNSLQPIQMKALEDDAMETTHKTDVTLEDLERYTQHVWDDVLHFLVGSTGRDEPPAAVVHFLLQTGLMQADPDFNGPQDDAPLVITQSGYDFMLQDNHQQVWHFLVQYLKSLQKQDNGQKLVREALLLLICLSFARVGEPYLASALNKDSRTMIKHLALFGILYTRKIGKATVFYPTRIALQIVGHDDNNNDSLFSLSTKALDAALADPHPQTSAHLAIIVQTNFQVCAYTTSALHLAMLGLFCDVGTIRRLPNIVIMHMTRDSVTSAFHLGIQARQILRFLEKHSHPHLRLASNIVNVGSAFSSPIPANVVDQIWLWDRERSRVVLTEVYQHVCLLERELEAVVQFAKQKGVYAWSSEKRSILLVDYSYAERIQKFARQWRSKAAVSLKK